MRPVVWRAWVSGRRWQSSRLRHFMRAASSALHLADILLVAPTHQRVISRGCELHRVDVALCRDFTKIFIASGNWTFESGQEISNFSSWVKGDPAKQVEDVEKEQGCPVNPRLRTVMFRFDTSVAIKKKKRKKWEVNDCSRMHVELPSYSSKLIGAQHIPAGCQRFPWNFTGNKVGTSGQWEASGCQQTSAHSDYFI